MKYAFTLLPLCDTASAAQDSTRIDLELNPPVVVSHFETSDQEKRGNPLSPELSQAPCSPLGFRAPRGRGPGRPFVP